MCARERKAKRNGTFEETGGRGTPAKLLASTSWKNDKVAGEYYGILLRMLECGHTSCDCLGTERMGSKLSKVFDKERLRSTLDRTHDDYWMTCERAQIFSGACVPKCRT